MIEIFFGKTKDWIGMSVESSVLTELQSKRLVYEWGRAVTGLIPEEGRIGRSISMTGVYFSSNQDRCFVA